MGMKRLILASVVLFSICFAAGCSCPCSSKTSCPAPQKVAAANVTSEMVKQ